MQIQVHSDNHIEGSARLVDWVSGSVADKLDRFDDEVTRVVVHLNDENGVKAGAHDSEMVRALGYDMNAIELAYRDSTGQTVEVTDAVEISFYPEGGSSGGEVILSQGERVAALFIDPFSGRVSTEFDEDISR